MLCFFLNTLSFHTQFKEVKEIQSAPCKPMKSRVALRSMAVMNSTAISGFV